MATRRYSIARGETEYNITEAVGAATATKSMEFTFDLAASLTREDVLEALDWFRNWIVSHQFPPA
jgi:hypothetical protein